MQAHGAARGGIGTPMPRGGGRLGGLLAVVTILVIVAAITWGMGAPAMSGVGAEDANLKAGAGSAVVHDDAGTMAPDAGSVVVHDDAGNVKP